MREQPRHLAGGFEMPLGIDREPEAGVGDGAFLADAGDDVGERPALRRVIEHVVDGDERRAEPLAELGQQAEPARLVAAVAMHAGEESAPGCARAKAARRSTNSDSFPGCGQAKRCTADAGSFQTGVRDDPGSAAHHFATP